MRWIIIFFGLLLIPLASAATFELESFPNGVINAKISDTNHVSLVSEPLDIEGIYELRIIDGFYDLRFEDSIVFRIANSVSVQNQQHIFSQQFIVDEPSIIRLKLPEGFLLSNLPASVLPKPTITSDGRTITLTWETETNVNIIAIYERSFEQKSNATSLAIIIIVIFIAFLFSLTVLYKTKKHLRRTLGDNELSIMRMLGSRGGAMTQKELVKVSHYSKSRISKLLARLEQKGFIERFSNQGMLRIKVKRKI